MSRFHPGDLVACFLTNTKIVKGLLQWGIVLEVSETMQDVLVLDNGGSINWYPNHRWTDLNIIHPYEKILDIEGILA